MRYRLQRHDGTDCSATMVPFTVLRLVPIQRYCHCFTQKQFLSLQFGLELLLQRDYIFSENNRLCNSVSSTGS